MTKELHLKSNLREKTGKKVKQLRSQDLVPAILYGSNLDKSIPLQVGSKDFYKVYQEGGENTLVKLNVEGDKVYNVVIHEADKDPVSDNFIHVDFYAVNMDEKITTKIPLEFEGTSDAVKNLGGILVKSKDELEIESLPADIPSKIVVDLSKLKTFDDIIRVEDLNLPSNIQVLDELNEAVATVAPPRSDEELKALDEKVEEKVEEVQEAGKEKEKEEEATTEPEK